MTDNDLDAWLNNSRALLLAARGDSARVEEAVRELGSKAFRKLLFSPAIVWDYLTISTPGLFEEAGYSDPEVEALTPMIDRALKFAWESRAHD